MTASTVIGCQLYHRRREVHLWWYVGVVLCVVEIGQLVLRDGRVRFYLIEFGMRGRSIRMVAVYWTERISRGCCTEWFRDVLDFCVSGCKGGVVLNGVVCLIEECRRQGINSSYACVEIHAEEGILCLTELARLVCAVFGETATGCALDVVGGAGRATEGLGVVWRQQIEFGLGLGLVREAKVVNVF